MSQTRVAAISQPLEALQRANHIRIARSELKAQIANGEIAAAEIILACPPEIASMPLAQLLGSQRGWGAARTRAFLSQVPLPHGKLIGSMTERQRNGVASLLTQQRRRSLNEAAHKLPLHVGAHGSRR